MEWLDGLIELNGKEYWVKKIAGRGRIGNINWGVDIERELMVIEREFNELRKYLGNLVLLTGGGGHGVRIGKLTAVWVEDCETYKSGKCLRVRLENLDPPIGGQKTFEPYIDSWQISVLIPRELMTV